MFTHAGAGAVIGVTESHSTGKWRTLETGERRAWCCNRTCSARLRDLIAQVPVEVVVCYSPDRLARKLAYQALLIEEFTRAGTRVEFVKGPRGDSPEDQLLIQFQGMFAEYEKAQILERSRPGKAHRAQAGSVNVLGGAPIGFRYARKTPDSGAIYEICEHEAVLVPAYAGTAMFGQNPQRRAARRDQPGRPPGRPVHPDRAQDHRPAQGRIDRHRGPGDHHRADLRPGRTTPGRQQTIRRPEHQDPVPAAGPDRVRRLRLPLLPDQHPHRQQEGLLLPVPWHGRLPQPGRAGLRQHHGPGRRRQRWFSATRKAIGNTRDRHVLLRHSTESAVPQ